MKTRRSCALLAAVGLAALACAARAEVVGLSRVASGFVSPTFVTHAPGDPDRLFVVEQRGTIRTFDRTTGQLSPQTFLDIRGLVDDAGGEQGLLGLAFHPDFQTNGHFYVNYTRDPGPGLDRTRIDRFTVVNPATDTVVSSGTRNSVLEFDQDFSNHNGGWLGFSPVDDYLYISTGDGGSGNDPNNRAQSLNQRLGKMLRVDVDGDDFPADTVENYAVPATNPFLGTSGALPEIWAYGLRNPWRNSFDRDTGDLWIGDVGQGAREEINFQAADSDGGENYGWRLREGDIQTPSVGGPEPLDYVGPVYDYVSNGAGQFGGNSTVGGYVYRGPDPEVDGTYFFGDSYPRQLWTFDPSDPDGTVQNVESLLTPNAGSVNTPVAFGEDLDGNLYIVDRDGEIFRIETDALRAGDYDGDGDVTLADYDAWVQAFGDQGSGLLADGNANGVVDAADFTVWRDQYAAPGGVGVPEPSSLLLAVVALAATRRPKRV
ncbi:Quinoprotein glucose dehydrogenase B precursor [Pseudobythopirellula maris]|uniref:Quinoprotein glucose dehydrogenase B n=1 Tax=Pseudobythopirellula maris TaxID=2527991 RepID=A0A5C5ZLW4_9BACT|nr:PQQ-dependent sugar dehydrogenase [Pseudobythopirellula maris]TWT88165.1 Quinoprotein glucose dehydrogenase B precursor [Pseudobythopirellula maris]